MPVAAPAQVRLSQPAAPNGHGITLNGTSVLRVAASSHLPLSFSAGGFSNVATVTAVVQNPSVETMQARVNAIDAAYANAAPIAKQLGVSLGGVVNVNAFDAGNTDGSCVSQYFVGPMGAQFPSGNDTTDADYVTVSVTSNVTITYGIE